MEKALIIGANGFLGRKLLTKFETKYQVIAADVDISGIDEKYEKYPIDITDSDQVEYLFQKIKPELTILTAAMTNVDKCEDFPELAHQINAQGPLNVAKSIKKINARLIHISTDFIFDGTKGNYSETDIPNPISIYGQSKLEGERNVMNIGIPYKICRTSVLYGWPESDQRDNFFSWVFKQLKTNNAITIIDGQITAPTLVDDLVTALFEISQFSDQEILHTTGAEAISRYEFVSKIIKIFNFDPLKLQKTLFFAQKAKRPNNSSLNIEKIKMKHKCQFKTIFQSLEYLKQQKNNMLLD